MGRKRSEESTPTIVINRNNRKTANQSLTHSLLDSSTTQWGRSSAQQGSTARVPRIVSKSSCSGPLYVSKSCPAFQGGILDDSRTMDISSPDPNDSNEGLTTGSVIHDISQPSITPPLHESSTLTPSTSPSMPATPKRMPDQTPNVYPKSQKTMSANFDIRKIATPVKSGAFGICNGKHKKADNNDKIFQKLLDIQDKLAMNAYEIQSFRDHQTKELSKIVKRLKKLSKRLKNHDSDSSVTTSVITSGATSVITSTTNARHEHPVNQSCTTPEFEQLLCEQIQTIADNASQEMIDQQLINVSERDKIISIVEKVLMANIMLG